MFSSSACIGVHRAQRAVNKLTADKRGSGRSPGGPGREKRDHNYLKFMRYDSLRKKSQNSN